MTDTNPVEAAQQPGTFDVLSFLEQVAYPTEKVVVFTDAASAEEYVKLNKERSALEAASKPDAEGKAPDVASEVAELTVKIEELGEKIRKSSLIFNLRGMPPGMVRDVLDNEGTEDNPVTEQDRDNELIAMTIERVTDQNNNVDPRVWDQKTVAKLRRFLKEGEFGKLVTAVGNVNLNAAVFDQATDAGFSGRGTDLA